MRINLECGGQAKPLPCPLEHLLLSAPAEAPTLVEGAMVLDSWAVVISESVVMTSKSNRQEIVGLKFYRQL